MRLNVEWIAGLREANFFARCLRQAVQLPGWTDVHAPLRLATDAESLHTMALMALAVTYPQFLQQFGFVLQINEQRDYEEVPVTCELPVIGNLGDHAVVCWLDAEATLLTVNGTAHGIKFDEVGATAVEVIERQKKGTALPELVVDPTWPTIAIGPRGGEQSPSDARDWPVALRSMDLR